MFNAPEKFGYGLVLDHLPLLRRIIGRDISARYKGSVFGLLWSLFNPLLMLAVYTFVFSVVFKAKWGGVQEQSRLQFAVMLFAGLIVHSFFSESVNRASTLITANANFVVKVLFPLELLPCMAVGSALFQAAVSFCVLLAAYVVYAGVPHYSIIYAPIVFMPLVLITCGITWFIASMGVFLRDIGQITVIATNVLMFLCPIFYPLSSIPERFQPYIKANPLTFFVEQMREVVVLGHPPNWLGLAAAFSIGILVANAGLYWFYRTKRAFADVI
jgi:lipopolysaccharide transport system permease protein